MREVCYPAELFPQKLSGRKGEPYWKRKRMREVKRFIKDAGYLQYLFTGDRGKCGVYVGWCWLNIRISLIKATRHGGKKKAKPVNKDRFLATQRVYSRAEPSLCWAQCGIQRLEDEATKHGWMDPNMNTLHIYNMVYLKITQLKKKIIFHPAPIFGSMMFHLNFPVCSSPTEMGPPSCCKWIISFVIPIYIHLQLGSSGVYWA